MNCIKVREHQIMTNEQYYSLIQSYEDARKILISRLEILDHSLYGSRTASGPVHTIQSRIKSKDSIEEKLGRMGKTGSISAARNCLLDIAGIRIICYFIDDIYNLSSALKRQNDLIIIKERDYITAPKANGYRSLHIVIGIPVYCLDTMEYFPVEVQLRTMSMDFWASMEHRICYKKNPRGREQLVRDFKIYADILEEIERQLESYSDVRKKMD